MTKTSITFLLDRTGSMQRILKGTISGFNAYLDVLKEDTGELYFTLIQFDSVSTDIVYANLPIADVPHLSCETYKPRGWTPLIEAAWRAIKAVEKSVAGTPAKVIVCIQTDGEENASGCDYTWQMLNDLIKEKTALGWQFNFMGASMDAYQQAGRMGISAGSTMSYDGQSGVATKEAFAGTARNARSYASGQSAGTGYSTAQKAAAGDVYMGHRQAAQGAGGAGGGSAAPKKDIVDEIAIPKIPA